jgi:hypothetical protein
MASDGWERQEPGWYTHDGYKVGITREHEGWFCWWSCEPGPRISEGPFRTLRLTKDWVRVRFSTEVADG